MLIFVRLKHAVNFLAADMMATKFVWIYVVGDDVASHEVVGDAIGMFMCEEVSLRLSTSCRRRRHRAGSRTRTHTLSAFTGIPRRRLRRRRH